MTTQSAKTRKVRAVRSTSDRTMLVLAAIFVTLTPLQLFILNFDARGIPFIYRYGDNRRVIIMAALLFSAALLYLGNYLVSYLAWLKMGLREARVETQIESNRGFQLASASYLFGVFSYFRSFPILPEQSYAFETSHETDLLIWGWLAATMIIAGSIFLIAGAMSLVLADDK